MSLFSYFLFLPLSFCQHSLVANQWLDRDYAQTHKARCSAIGAGPGEGNTVRVQVIFKSVWSLLPSTWSLCISSVPANPFSVARSVCIAWALSELHYLFTS